MGKKHAILQTCAHLQFVPIVERFLSDEVFALGDVVEVEGGRGVRG